MRVRRADLRIFQAGIPKFRLHHFRHNFITWGESIGLATAKTITRRYAGLREHPAKNASQMIADEMMRAIKEEAKKKSPRRSRTGKRERTARKGSK